MVHALNPSTRDADVGGNLCEFKPSLVYIVSFRTAKETERDFVSKPNQLNKKFFRNDWVSVSAS